jgi:diaminopimelate epimerase
MQGAGNDVVVLNAMHGLPPLRAEHFRILGDRRFGVGCDQILIVAPPVDPANDFSYRIVNCDGGEVEHCGNGARCFMRFVRDNGLTDKTTVRVEIARGVITLTQFNDGQVQVNMGAPRFEPESLPFISTGLAQHTLPTGYPLYDLLTDMGTATVGIASMGNPHIALVVECLDDAQNAAQVTTLGPLLEHHSAFPNRVNVGFMQVVDSHHIALRVWERGAGETLACGTGACAAVAIGVRMGLLQSPVQVQARGGVLSVAWDGTASGDVLMTGPAVSVFTGSIELMV